MERLLACDCEKTNQMFRGGIRVREKPKMKSRMRLERLNHGK